MIKNISLFLIFFLSIIRLVLAQDVKIESFDKPTLIMTVYDTNVLGEPIALDEDRITFEYLRTIPPGSGRWFTGSSDDINPDYAWSETTGNPGGAIVKQRGSMGASSLFYVFNNKNRSVIDHPNFSVDYFFGIESDSSDRLGAISHFTINEPEDSSEIFLRTNNNASNHFSDNGLVRYRGSSNTGIIFWDPNITGMGENTSWRTYDGGGLAINLDADWIFFGFAFGHSNMVEVENIEELVKIDNISIPISESVEDDKIPQISLTELEDVFVIFSDEIGFMYLVSAETEKTIDALKQANLLPSNEIALPVRGNIISKSDLRSGNYTLYVVDESGNIGSTSFTYVRPLSSIQIDKMTLVYPNPTSDQINVLNVDFEFVQILDMKGKVILTTKGNKIDVSHLDDGIYVLQIITEDDTYYHRINVIH